MELKHQAFFEGLSMVSLLQLEVVLSNWDHEAASGMEHHRPGEGMRRQNRKPMNMDCCWMIPN